jgi:hypothetical protein
MKLSYAPSRPRSQSNEMPRASAIRRSFPARGSFSPSS